MYVTEFESVWKSSPATGQWIIEGLKSSVQPWRFSLWFFFWFLLKHSSHRKNELLVLRWTCLWDCILRALLKDDLFLVALRERWTRRCPERAARPDGPSFDRPAPGLTTQVRNQTPCFHHFDRVTATGISIQDGWSPPRRSRITDLIRRPN